MDQGACDFGTGVLKATDSLIPFRMRIAVSAPFSMNEENECTQALSDEVLVPFVADKVIGVDLSRHGFAQNDEPPQATAIPFVEEQLYGSIE